MSGSTTTFNYTGQTVTYTVPASGTYTILADGAQGGAGETLLGEVSGLFDNGTPGGLGAEIGGDIALTQGEVLTIVAGGQGASSGDLGGGGGGGSFVLGPNNAALVIAGGGGGGGGTLSDSGANGTSGGAGNAGGSGSNGAVQSGPGIAGLGGTGGSGGGGANLDGAGGGGGLNSAGTSGLAVSGTPAGNGGSAAGGAGGDAPREAAGGFGGGGGAYDGGGGGGGYSGGGGGGTSFLSGDTESGGGGGGGGSFDGGQANLVQKSGVHAGNGLVTITPGPLTITSTLSNQPTTDIAAIKPFATVVVTDLVNGNPTETVTVVPSNTANGVLSDPNAATDGGMFSNGTYTVSGSAEAVQAAVDGLVFTPTQGESATTTFTITDKNSEGLTTTDSNTSVIATLAAQPSIIKGTVAAQATTDAAVINPFSNVTITDANSSNPTETVTVVPSNTANGVLSDPNKPTDGGTFSNGVYTVSGSATAVTAALDGLKFTPTAHEVAPGQSVTTDFTITDLNSVGKTSTDSNTSVIATAVAAKPALTTDPLSFMVAEGATTQNLYQKLEQNVQDTNFGAQISITSLGLSNTLGFAYLDTSDGLLTYTADGYQPNTKQPQDSFTYTAQDQYGQTVTGTVKISVSGTNESTQVGTSGADTLTASQSSTRLIGGGGNDTLNANAARTAVFAGQGDDTINVNAAKAVVHGGTGTNTINLGNTAQDSIVLQQGGTDNISGFNLHNGDLLDLTQVIAEAGKTAFSASDFQVTSSGNNATLSYVGTPSFTGGSALATLVGVGSGVTLQTLINDGALKTS